MKEPKIIEVWLTQKQLLYANIIWTLYTQYSIQSSQKNIMMWILLFLFYR